MLDLIEDSLLGYVAVAVAAATPWVELLVVIPVGVAVGLNVVAVGALAFLGNAAPVVGIVAAHDWWARRRAGAGRGDAQPPAAEGRRARARRVFTRYGLPGLALLGPAVTGIHLATVMALGLGAPRRRVAQWMTASLALWSVAVTIAAAVGSRLLRG